MYEGYILIFCKYFKTFSLNSLQITQKVSKIYQNRTKMFPKFALNSPISFIFAPSKSYKALQNYLASIFLSHRPSSAIALCLYCCWTSTPCRPPSTKPWLYTTDVDVTVFRVEIGEGNGGEREEEGTTEAELPQLVVRASHRSRRKALAKVGSYCVNVG